MTKPVAGTPHPSQRDDHRPPAPAPIPPGHEDVGTPLLKPQAPSSGSSGAKKG